MTEFSEDHEFVGFKPAADYLGMDTNTLSSYDSKGVGPVVKERRVDRQYVKAVYTKRDLDAWVAQRPGQGARTDLIKAQTEHAA